VTGAGYRDRVTDLATFTPDCSRCAALCCTALPYAASADFPESKPAGTPCRNLRSDLTCTIHAELRQRGWAGCTVFECFGAGQHVTQHTFGGLTWRDDPSIAFAMFRAFDALRLVQEVRYHLALLAAHSLPRPLSERVGDLAARADHLSRAPADRLTGDAAGALQQQAGPLFEEASRHLRRNVHAPGPARSRVRAHSDLAGVDLRGVPLDGADLRGALLIGADLRGTTLHLTDLLGADLRDARLHGADVRDALFLTQTQLNAARGDASTTVPGHLHRPRHWGGR
jgi:Pentapeptide repeats (8 copies)